MKYLYIVGLIWCFCFAIHEATFLTINLYTGKIDNMLLHLVCLMIHAAGFTCCFEKLFLKDTDYAK